MNWASVSEFLAMGGYGLYVWGSYGVTLLLLAAEAVALVHRQREAVAQAHLRAAKGAA